MPASKSFIDKNKKDNVILIRPISRKFYPVDYRDPEEPVWYNTPFEDYLYAKVSISLQLPEEVAKYIKIHRGRYIKEKNIPRSTTPFLNNKRLYRHIYKEEGYASEESSRDTRIYRRKLVLKKKLGVTKKRSPRDKLYPAWKKRVERFLANKKKAKKK